MMRAECEAFQPTQSMLSEYNMMTDLADQGQAKGDDIIQLESRRRSTRGKAKFPQVLINYDPLFGMWTSPAGGSLGPALVNIVN